jgi:hypothetical protein
MVVATVPDTLTLDEHRDRRNGRGVRLRWIGLTLLAAIPVLALLDVFGQRPHTSTASSGAARLQLYAPSTARGGLMYTARFRIDAHRELKDATLVLAPGWADQYTVNGVTPQPSDETSQNGKLRLSLGDVSAGQHYTAYLSLQVNPTNVGHHVQTVWLYDGTELLATIRHTITIWP